VLLAAVASAVRSSSADVPTTADLQSKWLRRTAAALQIAPMSEDSARTLL
jgi:hypothetical protein